MMPSLPIVLPVRPEVAVATPPEAATDTSSAGPGSFARAMRDAEAPAAHAEPAPDADKARGTRQAARERSGPGRTRTGDTPEAAEPSCTAGARARAEAADAPTTERATPAAPREKTGEPRAIDPSADDKPDAEALVTVPDAAGMLAPTQPPLVPPSAPAPEASLPRDSADLTDVMATLAGSTRRATGPVGGHGSPGRRPVAEAGAAASTAAGASRPALPGEARARADERAVDTTLIAAAASTAATKMASTEPVAVSTSYTMVEPTTPMSTIAAGAAAPALDGLAGRTAAEPPRSVAEARLAAAPGSPAFTQAFGEQMGVWVRDGVQEARIHLHPAELGPVQIQIALDGPSAQVDFHAAHARTREAIEASLPALASALRESGFTLAGGGVFGQGAGEAPPRTPPRAQRDADAPPFGSEAIGAIGDETLAAAAARSQGWRRGLLDVFA